MINYDENVIFYNLGKFGNEIIIFLSQSIYSHLGKLGNEILSRQGPVSIYRNERRKLSEIDFVFNIDRLSDI